MATPNWLYEWLRNEFKFEVDLAASEDNAKCDIFFTKEDSGLDEDWWMYGDYGFCNPPYSDIKPWIIKSIEQQESGFTTVMPIPTPNGEKYYADVFKHASEIIFITGRVAFVDSNGKERTGNTRGTCVVIFGRSGGNPKLTHVNRDDIKKKFAS